MIFFETATIKAQILLLKKNVKRKPSIEMKMISGISKTVMVFALCIFFMSDIQAQDDKPRTLPQFVFPAFSRGIVKMKAGNTYVAILNYNMVDEEMIFEQKGSYMILDKPEDIDTVFIQNRKFVPVGKAFYEVVVSGAAPFYIQHKSRYASAGTTTAFGMKSQVNAPTIGNTMTRGSLIRTIDIPDNVEVTPTSLSWVLKDGNMERFTTVNQLAKIFPDKEDDIKKYVKSNNLDLKEREDIIRTGKYCNGETR